MPRFRLDLAYDGRPFHGWQSQKSGRGVQDALGAALSTVCRQPCCLHASGRTDAGVHALGQVVHVDLDLPLPSLRVLRTGVNAVLHPQPVIVHRIRGVDAHFHARFDAVRRTYRYLLTVGPVRSLLWQDRSWFVPWPLCWSTVRDVAQLYVGTHNFHGFRSAQCQSLRPVRTIDSCTVHLLDDAALAPLLTRNSPPVSSVDAAQDRVWVGQNWSTMMMIEVRARAFLQRQVRLMVAAMVAAARGRLSLDAIARSLREGSRVAVGASSLAPAPALGLFLHAVDFPGETL